MNSKQISLQQKKASNDLLIIVLVTLVTLSLLMAFQSNLNAFANNGEIPILIRTSLMALMQFGVAGLGIIIVLIIRKENIFHYGLNRKNLLITILLSILVFIPSFIFYLSLGKVNSYLPFQKVWMTDEVLVSSFPTNVIGYIIIAIAWGFFEGFNYVVICDKINIRFPSKIRWLNVGAIVCSIMCLLIHGMIGITPENIIEAIVTFIVIYGMLTIRKHTGNAWGCIFIFVFLWNAF